MKARIKATGEIIKLAEYAKITLDVCDSYGNPIELSPEEVELIQDISVKNNIDWDMVRVQAAISAMQTVILNKTYSETFKDVATRAVGYANALVRELKK